MRIPKSVKVTMIALFAASILVSATYANIESENIELLYLFDSSSGNVARDSSGNDRDGEISGTKWVDGKFGGALEFGGVADDKVIATGYYGIGGTEPRTTVFWWKSEDLSTHSWVKGGVNAAGEKYFIRGYNPEATRIVLRVEVNGGYAYGSTNVCDGEWHHLAVVFPDGSDSADQHELYVDGALEGSPTVQAQVMNTNNTTTDIHIGTQVPGVNQHSFANGTMDELAIFNVALTQSDIATIMELGLATVLAVDNTGKVTATWAMIKTR